MPGKSSKLLRFLQNSETATSAVFWSGGIVVLYQLKEVIGRQIPCPCTSAASNVQYVWMFFSLPAIMLFVFGVLLQCEQQKCPESGCYWRKEWNWRTFCCFNSFQAWKRECCSTKLAKVILVIFCKALSLSLIWIGLLFLDGNYYACSMIMKNAKVNNTICAKLTCERNPRFFLHEYGRLCNHSRMIGISLHCILVLVAALILFYYICKADDTKPQTEYQHKYRFKYIKENNERIMEPLESGMSEAIQTGSENMKKLISIISDVVFEIHQNNYATYMSGQQTQSSPSSEREKIIPRLPLLTTISIKTASDKNESIIGVHYTVREDMTEGPQHEDEGSQNES
ncbi:uncharacterized protein LOC132832860 isoform X2 [Hemiscyllium ocellatum]|uniref:uncharacterized protein LOC132832860 isoform X2 n=1 Tax=Hemiscyllium ocellatum TaxID=170820 RepID=UPI0029667A08|nr:uncharacterized protein LOC132832860 isoform X2 [Hemiscyllium ocellatum]